MPKAVTHQDKCDALRSELYQPPPQLEADHTPDLENLREDDLPYIEVTFDEVGEAITSTSSISAPGVGKQFYVLAYHGWS